MNGHCFNFSTLVTRFFYLGYQIVTHFKSGATKIRAHKGCCIFLCLTKPRAPYGACDVEWLGEGGERR